MKTRRLCIFGMVAFMLIGGWCAAGRADTTLTREDINTFSKDPHKLEKLRKAVSALQAIPQTQGYSWFSMASIHGISSNDPRYPKSPPDVQALWNQCHKNAYLFFLWHRAYVAAMEKEVQEAISDPSFRMPYWDWYANPSIPEAFRNEFIDPAHTQPNSLYIKDRNPGINAGQNVWTPVVETDYNEVDFSTFQNQLNGNEHGQIHVGTGTGTNMGNVLFAGRDPIFFLHHSNIDRLLEVWIKLSSTHKAPTQFPQWISSVYRFPYYEKDNCPLRVYTPSVEELALNSLQAMGYQYENLSPPKVTTPPLPQRPILLRTAAATPVTQEAHEMQTFASVKGMGESGTAPAKPIEVSEGGTVDLAVAPTQHEKLLKLMQAEPRAMPPEQAPAIVFEDVQLKEIPPGVLSYRVFVNLPKEGETETNFREHFVGNISLFELGHNMAGHEEHMGHAGMGGMVRLPLPASVRPAVGRKLAAEKEAPSVAVSLVPVLAPGATAPKTPVLTIGQIRLEGAAP